MLKKRFIVGLFFLSILMASSVSASNDWQKAQKSVALKDWAQAELNLNHWLSRKPKDEEALFLLARVLAWQAKHQESAKLYDRLLHKRPDSADYLLGLAQVRFWQNQPLQAISLLNKAIKKNKKYQALWELLVRAHYAAHQPNRHGASADPEKKKACASRFPHPAPLPEGEGDSRCSLRDFHVKEAAKIQARAKRYFPKFDWQSLTPKAEPQSIESVQAALIEPQIEPLPNPIGEERNSYLELGGGFDRLDHQYDGWNNEYLGAGHRFNAEQKAYGRLTHHNRFALDDVSLMAGFNQQLSDRWAYNIETDESPSHNFLPKWSLQTTAFYKMDHGFGAIFGFRHASYTEVDNETGTVGLERYFGDWRIAYTLYVSQLASADQPTLSHLGQVSYYYGERSFFGISIGGGQQAVRLGPNLLQNANTQTYAIQGQHWLNPAWALVFDAGLNVQGESYTRHGANLGLRYAF